MAIRDRHLLDAVHDSLQALREEPLHDWVAVALWDGPHGDVSVIGEAPLLQLKSYLHTGVWRAAHDDREEKDEEIVVRSLDDAADVRTFDRGHMDVVKIAGSSIGRGTFEPGWRWSESVGPVVGRASCPLPHTGFVVAGQMHVEMDDGQGFDLRAGEAIHVSPGHDAWTIGDEPCVIIEILSAEDYAKT